MIILGISGGHDANWCVVKDGVLIGAFEKERFTRRRHDSGEVISFLDRTLKHLGIEPHEIDLIATSEAVHRETESGLRRLSGMTYKRPDEWQTHVVECLGRVFPCISVPHHLAHAAYARYTSPFANTAVITWDGGGDFYTEDAYSSTTVSSWRGAKLEWLERVDNSDFGSLWFMYSRAIFGDGNAAGKLMGLAALGSDKLVEAMADRTLAPVRGSFEGAWTIKNCWPDYYWPPLLREKVDWHDARAQDVAFAVQHLTNQAGMSIVEQVSRKTGHQNLALCGGVALNGYLNTAIRRSGLFADVFVPPAVNDGGVSAGCALFAAHHVLGQPWPVEHQASLEFTGMSYGPEEIESALREAGLAGKKMEAEEAESVVASALSQRQIVAWYEGSSEHGPRALGHRSIISLPDTVYMRDRLNREIKFREPYRPVAPVVLEDEAASFFEIDWPSPYMMYIVKANARSEANAPAAIHSDGTARVQTVKPDSSLGRLTQRVGELTGTPMLLNTSFNVRTPIVETPRDAVEAFQQVPIDLLYLGGWLVERPR
ncbi:MAG: carbamoyltransferase [Blastocatellia bacterium]|nr:carbamoyltransferase [Blastocatellia bacterium]